MPDLKTKQQLADAAKTLTQSYSMVLRGGTIFIPVHWQTMNPDPTPSPTERVWLGLTREEKQQLSNMKANILFTSDSEFRSFDYMLKQLSSKDEGTPSSILIRTPQGLRELDGTGTLMPPNGAFVPNFVKPMLNEDPAAKQEVFDVVAGWLNSEEEAHSLLHHLATILAPGWSAVKYVILTGEGRNGKSTLLLMLNELIGQANISNVTRQMIAEQSPTCAELNNKLVNIIMDGQMAYIKDSSMEKTLVAGERAVVRMLYESGTTPVQTNALFIEALQQEPKTRDKSPALQKRLMRYFFPNTYADDSAFLERMLSEEMIGAFLAVLIDHYVMEIERKEKLGLTKGSLDLQIEQLWLSSPVLQFLEDAFRKNPKFKGQLEAGIVSVETFLAAFKPWAMDQNMHERSDGDLISMLKTAFDVGFTTTRDPVTNKPTSTRMLKKLKPETMIALAQLEGVTDDEEPQEP